MLLAVVRRGLRLAECRAAITSSHLCAALARYVSTTIPQPTAWHSTFISATLHTDVVKLPSSHPDWDPTSSNLFIGVLGNTDTEYELRVTVRIKPPPRVTTPGRLRAHA